MKWICVSEKLPKENDNVLLQYKYDVGCEVNYIVAYRVDIFWHSSETEDLIEGIIYKWAYIEDDENDITQLLTLVDL